MSKPSGPDGDPNDLRRSHELFRLIVESARDFAIYTTDLERRVVTWNVGAERVTGYSEAEILGASSDIIFTPEDREGGEPEAEAAMALAVGRAEDERWHRRRDGSRFWASGLMMPLRDEAGGVWGLVKIFRDLTARKLAEDRLAEVRQQLEESELRYRLMVSEVHDYGIFLLDLEGRVRSWNAGAHRLKGYTEEEILGEHISRFFSEEDIRAGRPEAELRTAATEGRSEAEGWRVRKDGSRFWGNEVLTAIRNPDGTLQGFGKIVRDLTERKRAEDELRQARDELEVRVQKRTAELSLALSSLEREAQERRRNEQARLDLMRRLVTIQEDERRRISRELHDEMGQHLAGLSLELKLVRETLKEDDSCGPRLERMQEIMSQIGREVHRLAFELRPTALDDIGLQNTLENYLDEWSERTGITVEFHCSLGTERPPPPVETTLYRIVQEAMTNVLKHAGASRVGVVLGRLGGQIQLILEDNGRGFDAEAAMGPLRVGGRLGLLGMRERVAMVGGTLTIESTAGGPTTVFVNIPSFVPGAATDDEAADLPGG